MKSMKEQAIEDYILSIDFNGEWSVNDIKQNLRKRLGEEPGIEISHGRDVMINEVTGEAKEIKKMKSISIVYTDLDERIKRVEYLV